MLYSAQYKNDRAGSTKGNERWSMKLQSRTIKACDKSIEPRDALHGVNAIKKKRMVGSRTGRRGGFIYRAKKCHAKTQSIM